jgi:hypothetical protein
MLGDCGFHRVRRATRDSTTCCGTDLRRLR